MRCFLTLRKERSMKAGRCEILNAFDYHKTPPALIVCPLELLTGFDQIGKRLKEINLTEDSYSFRQLLTDINIMDRFSIVVLGSNRTTGWGKTNSGLRNAVW